MGMFCRFGSLLDIRPVAGLVIQDGEHLGAHCRGNAAGEHKRAKYHGAKIAWHDPTSRFYLSVDVTDRDHSMSAPPLMRERARQILCLTYPCVRGTGRGIGAASGLTPPPDQLRFLGSIWAHVFRISKFELRIYTIVPEPQKQMFESCFDD